MNDYKPRVIQFTNDAVCEGCGWKFPARVTLASDPSEQIATCALTVLIRCRCGTTKLIGIPAHEAKPPATYALEDLDAEDDQ